MISAQQLHDWITQLEELQDAEVAETGRSLQGLIDRGDMRAIIASMHDVWVDEICGTTQREAGT